MTDYTRAWDGAATDGVDENTEIHYAVFDPMTGIRQGVFRTRQACDTFLAEVREAVANLITLAEVLLDEVSPAERPDAEEAIAHAYAVYAAVQQAHVEEHMPH